jgi:hypothetical protein
MAARGGLFFALLLGSAAAVAAQQPPAVALEELRPTERLRVRTDAGWLAARFIDGTTDSIHIALSGGGSAAMHIGTVRELHVQRALPPRAPARPRSEEIAEGIFYLPLLALPAAVITMTGVAGGGMTGLSAGGVAGYLAGGADGAETGAVAGAAVLGAAAVVGAWYWAARELGSDLPWRPVRVSDGPPEAGAAPPPFRDPGMARLSALILPGGGHLYTGERRRGYTLLALSWGSMFVAMASAGGFESEEAAATTELRPSGPFAAAAALSLLFWGYGVLDADDSAARTNARAGYVSVAGAPVLPLFEFAGDHVRLGLRLAF